MSDSDEPIDLPDDAGDDLFGDGDDGDDLQSNDGRVLSDKDLASDQDDVEQHRQDDDMDMDQPPEETQDVLVQEVQLYRHRTPKTEDGTLKSLKPPSFLKWAAEEYKPDTFEPTEWDKQNLQSDNPKSVIRWQRDPTTGKLRSNAAIYRWSDGSVTLAVGNDHYDIQKKQMAPPSNKPYNEVQDSHYYAAAAHLSSDLMSVVGHISEQYTVVPNKNTTDDALATFASRMAAMARGKARDGDNIFIATKDPEAQRNEAEREEKERMKLQRKRDNAAARLDARPGAFRSTQSALSASELEGGRKAAGGARKRGQPGATRPKKRRPEYDSDDDLPAGRGRNEEYDREDDFIAPSDDEGSLVEDDDDDEELLDDDDEDEAPRSKRRKTVESEDEDADADADLDDDAPVPAAEASRGGRRRHIVDDDEDDE